LRTAINKLLIDHEQTTEFNGSLNRLLALTNDTFKTVNKKKKGANNDQSMMHGGARPLKEIGWSI